MEHVLRIDGYLEGRIRVTHNTAEIDAPDLAAAQALAVEMRYDHSPLSSLKRRFGAARTDHPPKSRRYELARAAQLCDLMASWREQVGIVEEGAEDRLREATRLRAAASSLNSALQETGADEPPVGHVTVSITPPS